MIRCLAPVVLMVAGLTTAADVPRTSPELAFTLADGRPALLSQYRGKIVALEFLLTTCPHCQRCTQVMEKMYKEYGGRGFQPLGVAINVDRLRSQQALAQDYVKTMAVTFPVGFTSNEMAVDYLQLPSGMRFLLPQLVFIDRKGTIVAHFPGGDAFFDQAKEEANFRAMIEKLLNAPAPAAGKNKAR